MQLILLWEHFKLFFSDIMIQFKETFSQSRNRIPNPSTFARTQKKCDIGRVICVSFQLRWAS